MDPGTYYDLGKNTGDKQLLIMTKFETGEFLAKKNSISLNSFDKEFGGIWCKYQIIVTLYGSLENKTNSFYHMLDCGRSILQSSG